MAKVYLSSKYQMRCLPAWQQPLSARDCNLQDQPKVCLMGMHSLFVMLVLLISEGFAQVTLCSQKCCQCTSIDEANHCGRRVRSPLERAGPQSPVACTGRCHLLGSL